MNNKVRLASGIMLVSLIVMLGFQTYWIKSAYEKNQRTFKNQIEAMLMSASQDLLIKKLAVIQKNGEEGSVLVQYPGEKNIEQYIRQDQSNADLTQLNINDPETGSPLSNEITEEEFHYIDSLVKASLYEKEITPSYFIGLWDGINSEWRYTNKKPQAVSQRGYYVHPFSIGEEESRDEFYIEFPRDVIIGASLKGVQPIIIASLLMLVLLIGAWYYIIHNLKKQYYLVQVKDDFISNMTHELKTPVAAAAIALEIMSKNESAKNDSKLTDLIKVVQLEQDRVSRMIDTILDNVSVGDVINENLERINVGEELHGLVESMQLKAAERQGIIKLVVPENNVFLDVYPIHFQNAILNLLDNALKYVVDSPSVNVAMKAHSSFIEIQIADNGIGISPEDRKRIFDKFFRVSTGNVHTVKGYGLGLNYTKSVIEHLGGTIKVDSEKDKGSKFTIRIPK